MEPPANLAIVARAPRRLAAAAAAAGLGVKTVVFDSRPSPAEQIYRGVERVATTRAGHLPLLATTTPPPRARPAPSARSELTTAATARMQIDRDRTA